MTVAPPLSGTCWRPLRTLRTSGASSNLQRPLLSKRTHSAQAPPPIIERLIKSSPPAAAPVADPTAPSATSSAPSGALPKPTHRKQPQLDFVAQLSSWKSGHLRPLVPFLAALKADNPDVDKLLEVWTHLSKLPAEVRTLKSVDHIQPFLTALLNYSSGRTRLNKIRQVLTVLHDADKLDPRSLTHLLKAMPPADVPEMFQWLKDWDVVAYPGVYNTVLLKLFLSGQLDAFEQFYNDMEGRGFAKTAATYGIMTGGYTERGMLDSALRCLEEGVDQSVTPGLGCWNSLLMAYARKGDRQKCQQLFARIEALHGSGTASYRALVMCALGEGNIDEARRMLEVAMEDEGTANKTMCTAIMNQILSYLCRHNRVEEAVDMWNECEKKATEADRFTYSIMMDGYALRGDAAGAEGVMEEMVQSGMRPDEACHRALLKAYQIGGHVNKAVMYAEWMIRSGLDSHVGFYTGMIKFFLRVGKMDAAKEWLDRIRMARHRIGATSSLVKWMEKKIQDEELKRSIGPDVM